MSSADTQEREVVVAGVPELHFPHEAPDRFMRWGQVGVRSVLETDGINMLYGLAAIGRIAGSAAPYRAVERQIFSWANGAKGVDLASKDTIGGVVQSLGYLAPRSLLVEPGADDSERLITAIEALDLHQSVRFCKPLADSQGRGIKIVNSPEEARAFVRRQNRPYLVQESLPPELDARYVLHRDVDQVRADAPPGWRIAYLKVRPSVTGDGRHSIGELVRRHPDMPVSAKRKYLYHHLRDLRHVPNDGEVSELISGGNVSQGAYGKIPSGQELNHLDTFMVRFLRDIEARVGAPFGTLCFDIGIRNKAVLQQPYNHDAMRANVVFYEHQLPFGMTGYMSQLPRAEGCSFVGREIKKANRNLLLRLNLESSIRATGRALRKR